MSDIDDCLKSVEQLTRDRGEVMRAGSGVQAMTRPREAQLELLLSISEGLSRGSHEMLRVSPTDAMHAPSCGLAIRDAVEELKWMRAEIERLHEELALMKAGFEVAYRALGDKP